MRHRQRREPQAKAAGNSDSPRTSLEARRARPAGVGEQGIGKEGSSRNLGELVISAGDGGTAE
jgi:hypothetical protein